MANYDTQTVWTYHNATKHSYWSIRSGPHRLDWDNQPLPFKVYKALEAIPLPRALGLSSAPALAAIAALETPHDRPRVPDLTALTRILYFTAGVTKRLQAPDIEMHFRAASCTGALYHHELYLVCGDLPGLPAGVYHFGAHDLALRRLRTGDYRDALVDATANEPAVAKAPVTLVFTDVPWRNAWKYQARAYRHTFWDGGTMLAHTLALAAAHDLPTRAVLGFVDDEVNRLLGLEPHHEAAILLVPLGDAPEAQPGPPPPVTPLGLEALPYSRREVDYPTIWEAHDASYLATSQEVAAWRSEGALGALPEPSGRLFPLQPLADGQPRLAIEEVIVRRGSARRFLRQPIPFTHLSTVLQQATRGVPADALQPPGATLNDLYLIVNDVEDLPAGAYILHRDRGILELLKEGDFREQTGYLALEQGLAADASVAVFFLADLHRVLNRFGNRGYRAAQLEAGTFGGKSYLGAYALGLGATGLTFYDDDVTAFFSPYAQGKSAMFLVCLGRSARRRAPVPNATLTTLARYDPGTGWTVEV